jgi:HTH-type transcriptional regulator/antitoxin HipB
MKPIDPKIEARTRSHEQLGKAIRRFRILRGWSQADLGKKTGIGQAKISMIESGKRRPEASTLFTICNALAVDIVLRPRSLDE